jgi:hypothetical protein
LALCTELNALLQINDPAVFERIGFTVHSQVECHHHGERESGIDGFMSANLHTVSVSWSCGQFVIDALCSSSCRKSLSRTASLIFGILARYLSVRDFLRGLSAFDSGHQLNQHS